MTSESLDSSRGGCAVLARSLQLSLAGLRYMAWDGCMQMPGNKDLSKHKSMNSEQVSAELGASNYLTKWVD